MGSSTFPAVLTAIAVLTTQTAGQSCSAGSMQHGDHCFWLSPYPQSYANAKSTCESIGNGNHLAVIPDEGTNDFLKELLRGAMAASAWIGLDDMITEGTFTWANNYGVVGFANWRGNTGNTASKDCVSMERASDYQWVVNDCLRGAKLFICQSDVPTSFEYKTLVAKLDELRKAIPGSFAELGLADLQEQISELKTMDLANPPDTPGMVTEHWGVATPQAALAYDTGGCDATFAFIDPELSELGSANPAESLGSLKEKVEKLAEAAPVTAGEALPNVQQHLDDLIVNTNWGEVTPNLPVSPAPDRNVTAPIETGNSLDSADSLDELRVKRATISSVVTLSPYWSWIWFPWGWWWYGPHVIIIITCCPLRIYIIIRWPWIWWPWYRNCQRGWTRWFDRDDPTVTGDWETLTNLRQENPGEICDNPSGIEARVVGTHAPAATTGEVFSHFDVFTGFVCRKNPPYGDNVPAPYTCQDYEVRFWCPTDSFPVPWKCPGWTLGWFDVDDPSVTGDWEYLSVVNSLNPGQACSKASGIQVRTVGNVPAGLTGEVFHRFGPNPGFVCRKNPPWPENVPAPHTCQDYEVRFKCP